MEFSKKKLFKSIKQKYSHTHPGYLRYAKEEIDKIVDEAEINDSFYNEYYHLKRDIELKSIFLSSIGIAALISVAVSYALNVEGNGNYLGYIVILTIGMVMAMVLAINSATKQGCVLEPYLLEKMKKKIWSESTVNIKEA